MPVKLYQETDVTKKISHLTFCVESAESIEELAHVQVVTDELYDVENKRAPVRYGLLDPRMGVSQKNVDCETCGKSISDCNGHFGYLDLDVPLYHTGFFPNIITILQSICKKCGQILLVQKDKDKYVRSLSNPHLSYFQKKELRKVIIKKCKKSRICLNCTYVNGIVKKFVSSGGNSFNKFGIVHVKPEKDKECREKVEQYTEHFKITGDVELDIVKSLASEVLTPVIVLNLFKNIPESDIIFLCMNPLRSRPEDLIMTKMLIPPVCVRPSVASTLREGTMEDHLTAIQQEILYFNREFARSKSLKINPSLYNDRLNELQLKAATFFNGEISGIPLQYKMEKRKGLMQRLSGKNGRFRGNLSGKRVNFSARTVISPDPNLEIDQVGVPVHIAKILTFTEKVNKINMSKMKQLIINGPEIWPGANYIMQKDGMNKYLRFANRAKAAQDLQEGDEIERHMADNDMVLMNRQPSLHRLSIMAHRVKVHFHRTFRINECVCNPYNADFDGDEMNLHLPQTIEAKAEAYEILNIKNNLITPKNGEILIAATQDFLSGAFAITRKERFYTFRQVNQLLTTLLAGDDINMDLDIPEPAILKPKRLWTGKQIFGLILRPNKACPVKLTLEVKGKSYTKNREFCKEESYIVIRNSEILAGSLDKSHLGSGGRGENIFYVLFKDFKADYSIKCMWRLARMASYHLMNTVGFSIGIGDVMPNERLIERKNALLEKGYDDCHNLIQDNLLGRLQCQPGCSTEQTLESRLLKTLSDIRDNAGKVCLSELHPTNSPLIMALCGSKGSNINISQMVACVGQQALNGERVPFSFDRMSLPQFFSNSIIPSAKGFVKNSFFSGMVPSEFFFHTMGGREGLVDTAVKTAESGYMQRRLIKALEDLVVCHDKTVRNADNQIVQLLYGNDGLDPAEMETSECPVDFNRILHSIKAQKPCRNEASLDENEICIATKQFIIDDLSECDEGFKSEFCNFLHTLGLKVSKMRKIYGSFKISAELERVTATQLVTFASVCRRKYKNAIIEAGTAVGAVAAQSIGEPGTQMTLKTFHFAGVASMNITQGVPRIKEIINASKSISTPIIETRLLNPTSKAYAARVKARLEKTTLKEISHFQIVLDDGEGFLKIVLNSNSIRCLLLEINAHTVRYNICKAKLKIQPQDVVVKSSRVLFVYPGAKEESISNSLRNLQEKLQNVIIKGLPTANRVVTATKDKKYYLCVEGSNMRDIMATYGVNGHLTTSNNIIEVYETLGIEAARNVIVREIESVLKNHGMSVDIRHIMLLATQMTRSGAVLGITRSGLAKMNQSVLTLASFEKTIDHLYDAAYYGRTDAANGVSENIIMGMPVPVGTSALKLISPHVLLEENRFSNLPLLFENS